MRSTLLPLVPSLPILALCLACNPNPDDKGGNAPDETGDTTESETSDTGTDGTDETGTTGSPDCFADVTDLVARPGDAKVQLDWTNPGDAGLSGVRIQMRTDGTMPADPDDGMTVYEGPDESVVIDSLTNDTEHMFRAFAFDDTDLFACGVDVATTPNPPWLTETSMPAPRTGLGGAAVDDKVYVIGGTEDCNNAAYASEYDPATDMWTDKTEGPIPIGESQVVEVDGKLYGWGVLQVTEYDPAADTWTECGGSCGTIGAQRNGVAAAAHGGKIYYFGGWDPMAMASVDETREFDTTTGQFTDCGGTCAPMPTARRFMRAATVGDRIYVVGGIDGLDVVEEYDPTSDTWTNCGGSCAAMPDGRSSFAMATVRRAPLRDRRSGGRGLGQRVRPDRRHVDPKDGDARGALPGSRHPGEREHLRDGWTQRVLLRGQHRLCRVLYPLARLVISRGPPRGRGLGGTRGAIH